LAIALTSELIGDFGWQWLDHENNDKTENIRAF